MTDEQIFSEIANRPYGRVYVSTDVFNKLHEVAAKDPELRKVLNRVYLCQHLQPGTTCAVDMKP